jgi:hypothetical protein
MKKNIQTHIEHKNGKVYIWFYKNQQKLSFKQGIKLLKKSKKFRSKITKILKRMKGSWMWKITAINRKTDYERKDKYFKMTIIPSKFHHKQQDISRFETAMKNSKDLGSFVYFTSPSGNILLVPKDLGYSNRSSKSPKKTPKKPTKSVLENRGSDFPNKNPYMHFSNFIKYGPKSQVDDFWRIFATLFDHLIHSNKSDKLYINTHGHDVPWLHVRFDKGPEKVMWK